MSNMSDETPPPATPGVACAHPEAIGARYGDPISAERQAELQAMLDAWNAPGANHGDRKGPFAGEKLTGADVSWLADQSGRDANGWAPNLHLEGVNLHGAHLESSSLNRAHLEASTIDHAHLEGASLYRAHLEGADLVRSHLEDTRLYRAHLEGAYLGEVHMEGANLRRCWLDGRTVLNKAVFDHGTSLGDIQWSGVGTVNLTQIAWERVSTLGDERDVGLRAKSDEHAAVVRAYRQVAAQLRAQGMSEVADRFAYRAQTRQRWAYLRSIVEDWRRPWRLPGDILRYLGSAALALLAGYGYRPGRTIILYLAFIAAFAATYFAFGTGCAIGGPQDVALILLQQIPHGYACASHPTPWSEAFIISFTAFHGRGFLATDITPSDPQAAVAAAEAVLGLVIEVSFIATFTQRFFGSK